MRVVIPRRWSEMKWFKGYAGFTGSGLISVRVRISGRRSGEDELDESGELLLDEAVGAGRVLLVLKLTKKWLKFH